MCFGSAPAPTITKTPAEPRTPQATPEVQDPQVTAARDEERRKRAAAANATQTTGAAGDTTPVNSMRKALYGD